MDISTRIPTQEQLVTLYNSVGWSAYTRDPEALVRAVANSDYVVTAWEGETLIGLARALTDDVAIFFLQDILVHPDYHRKGIGRALLEACLQPYAHVRTKALLTDDQKSQKRFYESLGFVNMQDIDVMTFNAFLQMEGITG